MSVLHRIWRYKFHYILVVPFMLFIFIFKVIPFLGALYLPFIDYEIFKGFFNSEWVGMRNFKALFENPAFLTAVSNTIIIKFGYIFCSGLIALIVSLGVSSIASGKLRSVFSTLFLMPFFIPSVVLAYLAMFILSPSTSPFLKLETLVLAETALFRPALIAVEVLQTCGIPIIMAVAAIAWRQEAAGGSDSRFVQTKVIPAAKAIVAFMLLQLSTILTTDFELISSLYNPLVYEVGDTMDTFQFRVGFMMADYNSYAASSFIQLFVQVLFTFLAYFLVKGLFFNDIFDNKVSSVTNQLNDKGKSVAGFLVSALYGILVLIPLYVLFVYPFTVQSAAGVSLADVYPAKMSLFYLLINLVAVIINFVFTASLAYPLTVKDLPGRRLYKAFLLLVMVMGAGTIHEYLLVRSFEMVNTFFSHLIYGFFTIVNVFVIKSIFNARHAGLKEQASIGGRGELSAFFTVFLAKMWKPLLALSILQFVSLWNSFYVSMIYLNDHEMFSPVLHFRNAALSGQMGIEPGNPVILQLAAATALPSVLLLIIFRKLLTSETLVSQIRKL